MKTLNNKLAVEPYTGHGLNAEVKGGFAFAKQANSVVALTLKADGKVGDIEVKAGQQVFFEERTLNEEAWAKKTLLLKIGNEEMVIMLADATKVVGVV